MSGSRRKHRDPDPFVGRIAELTLLLEAVESAAAGKGGIVLVAGEPGIGKSRLAVETGKAATALGTNTFWGTSYDDGGAPSYWPWVQVLRSVIQAYSNDAISVDDGIPAAVASRIAPELRQCVPDVDLPPDTEDSDADRFRLFDCVSLLLQACAREVPMVVILDDLHWSDAPSLSLLEHLCRDLPSTNMLVVATYRDTDVRRGHRLSRSLGAIARLRGTQRIRLRGLTADDVGDLVAALPSDTPSDEVIRDIADLTDGSPLFIRELSSTVDWGSVSDRHLQTSDLRAMGVPEGIREAIGARLDTVSDQCNNLLKVAAVAGSEFSRRLVISLMPEMETVSRLKDIDEAVEAGILDIHDSKADTLRFVHSLFRETILEEISTADRVRTHLKIVDTLEQQYGASAIEHAAEIVEHAIEAALLDGAARAAAYCLAAGSDAVANLAHEEAESYFRRGLALQGLTDLDAARLSHGLARVLIGFTGNEAQEVDELLDRAFRIYETAGDRDGMIAVASTQYRWTVLPIAEEALPLADPGTAELSRLLAQTGLSTANRFGDYQLAASRSEQAIAIAEALGDDDLQISVLSDRIWTAFYHRKYDDCGPLSQRVVDVAKRSRNPRTTVQAEISRWTFQYQYPDVKREIVGLKSAIQTARANKDRWWVSVGLRSLSGISRDAGEWQESREAHEQWVSVAPDPAGALASYATMEAMIGNRDRAVDLGQRALREPGDPLHLEWVAAYYPDAFDLDQLYSICHHMYSQGTTPQDTYTGLGSLLYIDSIRNDRDSAARHYRDIMARKPEILPVDCYVIGQGARTAGETEAALEHFAEADEYLNRSRFRSWIPGNCFEYARTLLERGDSGDVKRAARLVANGQQIARSFGMKPAIENLEGLVTGHAQLQREMAGLEESAAGDAPGKGPPDPTVANPGPFGLTKREIEVLGLMAKGFTNPDIARMLSISDKTVGNHATSIFSKTGTANRTEAAACAIQNAIV